MAEFQYVITDGAGLHARPAAQLARLVKETDCAVTVEKEGQTADASRSNVTDASRYKKRRRGDCDRR